MRKKLLACLITAAASFGSGLVFADEGADAATDVAPVTEVEAVSGTDASGTDESTTIHVYLPPEDGGDGSTPEVVVDPVPIDDGSGEELPTYDVVDGETPTLYTDPPADEQPVVDAEPVVDVEPVVDEQPVVVDEPPVVDGEKPVVDEDVVLDEDIVGEEEPIAMEGGQVPVEGGGTAELVTTTSSGSEEDSLIYTTTTSTRGPEGCMECRTLTGVGEELPLEAAPEVTADVIDDNAMPVQAERAKRRNTAR